MSPYDTMENAQRITSIFELLKLAQSTYGNAAEN